jgi:hypothetical protein
MKAKLLILGFSILFFSTPCMAWYDDTKVDLETDSNGHTTGKIGNQRVDLQEDNGRTTGTIQNEGPPKIQSVYAPSTFYVPESNGGGHFYTPPDNDNSDASVYMMK